MNTDNFSVLGLTIDYGPVSLAALSTLLRLTRYTVCFYG